MPMSKEEQAHLGGDGVVVKFWYADPDNPGKANVSTALPDELALELWQDAAFTNGGPLVKVELIWSPKEAQEIEEMEAADEIERASEKQPD